MVDIHSHILPNIDDGARNIETSFKILEMMKEQGITKVYATPHFYPAELSLEEFLLNRKKSYEMIKNSGKYNGLPEIIPGCELFYFRNMGKSDSLNDLTLGNSGHILIELSDGPITEQVINDLSEVFSAGRLIPVIAHIERYVGQKGYRKLLKFIKSGGTPCKAQLNASALTDKRSRIIAKKLIKKGYISYIATDSHSLNSRPPKLYEAMEIVLNEFGEKTYKMLIENAEKL